MFCGNTFSAKPLTYEFFVVFLQKEIDNAMCTVTVNIDENLLRSVNPDLTSTAAIRKWAQQLIDGHIQEMMEEDEETVDLETAREMLHETIRREYARL